MTTWRAKVGGTSKLWDTHLAKAAWTAPPQPTLTCCRRRQSSCSAHKKYAGINSLGHCCLTQRHAHTHGSAFPYIVLLFLKDLDGLCGWCDLCEDGKAQCLGQGDLILGESRKLTKLHDGIVTWHSYDHFYSSYMHITTFSTSQQLTPQLHMWWSEPESPSITTLMKDGLWWNWISTT